MVQCGIGREVQTNNVFLECGWHACFCRHHLRTDMLVHCSSTCRNTSLPISMSLYVWVYICMHGVYACVFLYVGFCRHHLSTNMLFFYSSNCRNTLKNIAKQGFTSSSGHRQGCLHGPCFQQCTRQY